MKFINRCIVTAILLFGSAHAADYYGASGDPATGSALSSSVLRAEYSAIGAGFAKVAPYTGNASKAVIINSGGTGQTVTTGTLGLAGNFATTGAFNTTLIQGATTSLTLPLVSGTLATLAGTEAFTNKTYNGNTWTAGTGILTFASGKTLTISNTLTLAGTDSSTLNIGTGGTLGTAAFVATGTSGATIPLLNGTNTASGAWTFTSAAPQLTLGANTTTLGSIKLFGNTSGDATVRPAAVAGTATVITLPATSVTLNAAADITGTTLASNVVTASLTSVGALNSGSITSGFGSIDVGADTIRGGYIGLGTAAVVTYPIDARSISGQSGYMRYATNDFAASTTGTALEGFFGATTGNSTVTLQATNTGGSAYGPFSIDASTISLRPGGVTAISATSSTVINMTASGATLTVGVGADNGTVSAGIFTDRTKYFEGDALAELSAVSGAGGHIDHDTLPAFARANIKRDVTKDVERIVNGRKEIVTEKVGETTVVERDLGAMISMLTVAVKQLTERLVATEKKLAAIEGAPVAANDPFYRLRMGALK